MQRAPSANKWLSVAELQSASAGALQAQVQAVQDALGVCQAAYAKASTDVTRSTTRIQQLQQQITSLQEEDGRLSLKVPLPVNRVVRVRQWLADKAAALETERAALEGRQLALLKAESQLRAQETEASLLDEAALNLSTAAAAADTAALRGAAAARGREAAAARRQLAQQTKTQQQAAAQQAARQQEADARSRAADKAQAQARQRLGASLASLAAGAAAVADAAAAQHDRQWQSLLQLKDTADKVRAGVARKAETTRQLRKQKEEQERREFELLQEQGLNPYEVYRVRSAEAAAAKAASERAALQQQRRAALAAALSKEDEARRKQQSRAEFDRQVEQNYQQQMGVTAQQQRTDGYMRSHTLSKQALLDPTSRVPVFPSDAVVVKPAGFGLGGASPEAVAKVAAKHGHLASSIEAAELLADCVLLPRRYRSGSASPSNTRAAGRHTAAAAAAAFGSPAQDEARGSDGEGEPSGCGSDSEGDEDGVRDEGSPSSAAAAAATTQGSSSSSRPLKVTQLSKLEADRLQRAKEHHRATLTQPKASRGRVFGGDAFIAQPPAVAFKDFVPGQTYSQSVALINRSFTGSSIRLGEVPAELMHVVELHMPPSGCLAPGASATLRVTFRPQADEPLLGCIPLLADSGPLSLPFSAVVRQALPAVTPSPVVSVDGRAGGVMLGASSRTEVAVTNGGVLDVLFEVKVVGPLSATAEYEDAPPAPAPADASEADLAALQEAAWGACCVSVAGLRVVGSQGRVRGYSSSSFSVEFSPRVPGPVEVPVLVSFTACDRKGLAVPPVALTLQATGRELPVSTLTPLVDFKCVMFGREYSAPLLLSNAGKAAAKVLVVAKPALLAWVTLSPDFGFIQAGDTLAVSVTLKPTPDMMHTLAEYLVPDEEDTLRIPLTISAPGQPLPLPVKLRVQATTSKLRLHPRLLDFGRVPLTEAAGLALTVSNPSLLPQRFSFGAVLPQGLKLTPNAGYGCVLPRDSVTLLASFQPPIPGEQFFELTCRTTAGRVFRVEGKCNGLQPPVALSHNVVHFPATAGEDSSSASVVLRNTSGAPQLFEFGVPQGSHLQVTPRVGLLRPGGSLRVQLDFSPPAALCAASAPVAQDAAPAAAAATTAGSSCEDSASADDGHSQQQLQQQYREWLLPCYICKAADTAGGGSTDERPKCVLHVSAVTCAVLPELRLVSPPGLPQPEGKGFVVLDLGALPVGERICRELLLQNTGADVALLAALPLDPTAGGAFAVVNALRPLQPHGGTSRVLLAFEPPDCSEYQEMLCLRSCKSRVRVCLRGRGIAPTLSVSPASAALASGGLDFGDVLLSDPVCKELRVQVTNTCPFSVTFSTRFIGPGPPQPQQQPATVASVAPAAAATPAGKGMAAPAASKPAAAGSAAAVAVAAPGGQQPQQPLAPPEPVAATASNPGEPSGCFVCSPSSAMLAAGATQELVVAFQPLPPAAGAAACQPGSRGPWGPLSPYVADRLQIVVPHQRADLVVRLQGNAWPDGMYVSGPSYRSATTAGQPGAQDPFAALRVAAAIAAVAAAASPAGVSSSSSKGKAGGAAPAGAAGAAAAAATAAARAELAAALTAAGHCSLSAGFLALPGPPVAPGSSSSISVEFGAVRPSGSGAAAGEVLLDELPLAARDAGWSVEPPAPSKVAVPLGERRPLVIRYTAPPAAKLRGTALGALARLQLPVEQVLRLGCTLKGGCQPVGPVGAAAAAALLPAAPDGTRRVTLVCTAELAPSADI